MANEPVQVQSNNPSVLFNEPRPVWPLPKVSVGVPDPKPQPNKLISFDERIDIIRTSGVLKHRLPMISKSQVYVSDEEAVEEYKQREAAYLTATKKRAAPPKAQQEALPVDAETLEQAKRQKLEQPPAPVKPPVPEYTDPIVKTDSPAKRQKFKSEPELEQQHIVVPSQLASEEPDSAKDESSSSEVENHSAIASDIEEKEPEEEALSEDAELDDDVQYLAKKTKPAPPESSSSEESSSEQQPEEGSISDGDSSNESDNNIGGEKSSSSDESDSDDDLEIGGEESSSSGESSSSMDDVPLTQRPSRTRKAVERYNDADFPDEEPKAAKKGAANAEPETIKVAKADIVRPTNKILAAPASKRRNNPTDEMPPNILALSTVDKFKKCGRHLTRLYTHGWSQLMDNAIDIACTMEFKEAGRSLAPPASTINVKPVMLDFLCGCYTEHLFNTKDPSQFPVDSDDAEILRGQRNLFVYREYSSTNLEKGWSEIKLWEPYEWALERGYPPHNTIHMKTEHLAAYTALRCALYPQEYVIYRARMAVHKKVVDHAEKRTLADFSAAVKSQESFKLGLCNDWIVCCQLADIELFESWSRYDNLIAALT